MEPISADFENELQALRELKADPETAAIPVVMVTVFDEKRKGFALGATEYLVKPAERAALLQVVRRLAPLPSRSPEAVLTIENTAEGQRELVDAAILESSAFRVTGPNATTMVLDLNQE